MNTQIRNGTGARDVRGAAKACLFQEVRKTIDYHWGNSYELRTMYEFIPAFAQSAASLLVPSSVPTTEQRWDYFT